MSIQDEIYKKIKEEIANDPFNVGYAGKTDAEIQQLLNNPVPRQKVIDYFDQAPMNRILSGIKDAPNIVSSTDVTAAKLSVSSDPIIDGG
jgi:hypothetical protein